METQTTSKLSLELCKRYISTVFVYHLPRLYTLNIDRPNGFILKKEKRQYPAETITMQEVPMV